MSDLEQYAKEHQVPIMMDGGLKFLLEQLQKNQCLSSTAQPVSENHQQLSSFSPVNPRSIFPFPLSSENKTQLVYPGE